MNTKSLGIACVFLALATSACGSAESTASGDKPASIVMADYGGSYADCERTAIFEPWTDESGVAVTFGPAPFGIGPWRAQQESGNVSWDLADVNASQGVELIKLGYLESLGDVGSDVSFIDQPDMRLGDEAVAMNMFANVISYRTDAFSTPPTTWADVFDTDAYPGKRLFNSDPTDYGVLEMALLADGVAPAELYPLDVDRALGKLDTIKDDIIWWESGSDMVTLLEQGDAVIGAGWDGRIKDSKASGASVDFTYNEAITKVVYWGIPSGAEHPDEARALVEFALQPEAQARMAECSGHEPINAEAVGLLDDFDSMIPAEGDTWELVPWSQEYWGENMVETAEQFRSWLGQ
jgi:putative spermidine/putrescine transport system substrate-binding protein